jgi:hypothetical protein
MRFQSDDEWLAHLNSFSGYFHPDKYTVYRMSKRGVPIGVLQSFDNERAALDQIAYCGWENAHVCRWRDLPVEYRDRSDTPEPTRDPPVMFISFDDLNRYITECMNDDPNFADEHMYTCVDENDDVPFANASQMFGEASQPEFVEFLIDNGFYRRDDGLELDPMKLDVISQTAADLMIDNPDKARHELLWAKFDLGGDDDEDYHGSHVLDAIDVLRAYCDAHDIAHT